MAPCSTEGKPNAGLPPEPGLKRGQGMLFVVGSGGLGMALWHSPEIAQARQRRAEQTETMVKK